jgi:uncharacterized repeat protein (TIGR03803 family)
VPFRFQPVTYASCLYVTLFAASAVSAQQFRVIHTFSNGKDGAFPYAGLTIDYHGNLYGTANQGGDKSASCQPASNGCGTVFELSPTSSGFSFHTLYAFTGGTNDGQGPYGSVILGPDDNLYGTTLEGGNTACLSGCGTVYRLNRPAERHGYGWTESVLYTFNGNPDGIYPAGPLTFDASGNLYGTTSQGGAYGPGTIYELFPSSGDWSEEVLYNFNGQTDGGNPYNGVVLGQDGNLYGTALDGGPSSAGTAFELSQQNGSWTEDTLYGFQLGGAAGAFPVAGLTLESSGAMFGATESGGPNNGGTVFSLTSGNGSWTMNTLFSFTSSGGAAGPWGNLVRDSAGNLYGTTQGDPANGNWGTVFKLSPANGSWQMTVLHTFTGAADGGQPYSSVVFDSAGNLYGTTNVGGAGSNGSGYGVVFEITSPIQNAKN